MSSSLISSELPPGLLKGTAWHRVGKPGGERWRRASMRVGESKMRDAVASHLHSILAVPWVAVEPCAVGGGCCPAPQHCLVAFSPPAEVQGGMLRKAKQLSQTSAFFLCSPSSSHKDWEERSPSGTKQGLKKGSCLKEEIGKSTRVVTLLLKCQVTFFPSQEILRVNLF